MKHPYLSRRNFFKLSAITGSSLALWAVVNPVPHAAVASSAGPASPAVDATPPAFTPISSTLSYGATADVSMGWDGTLWARDTSNGAHLFDGTQNVWQPHGDGVDGVALIDNLIYHFVGGQFVKMIFDQNTISGSPQSIVGTWSWLPYAFTYGVQGAANVAGHLTLFNGGRYVQVNPDQPTLTRPLKKLADLVNWPSDLVWAGGAIDAVMGDGSGTVWLFRNATYITVDLVAGKVLSKPASITDFVPWQGRLPADWASSGIDAAIGYGGSGNGYTLYRGSSLVYFVIAQKELQPQHYIPSIYAGWPSTWLPLLTHAPSGRANNLWAATTTGGVVHYDGTQWNDASIPDVAILSVAVGSDGLIFALSSTNLYARASDAAVWQPPISLTAVGVPVQVSVGDAAHVWILSASKQVWRYNGQPQSPAFTQVNAAVPATHIAANADGTLWHCDANSTNAYRFISEGNASPEAIPVPTAGAGSGAVVQRIASNGFGNSFCLVQATATGATAADAPQIYSYNSNYNFKTSQAYNADFYGWIEQGLGRIFFTVTDNAAHSDTDSQFSVVALDAQTGTHVWQTPASANGIHHSAPVYDPNLQLIYVCTGSPGLQGVTSTGSVMAFDAITGKRVWTSSTAADGTAFLGIDAAPALSGTFLCFGDRAGRVHAFNTEQALAAAKSGASVRAAWSVQGLAGQYYTRVQTPLLYEGKVYFVTWTWQDGASGQTLNPQFCKMIDGSGEVLLEPLDLTGDNMAIEDFVSAPPALGEAIFEFGDVEPCMFICAGTTVFALSLTTPSQWSFEAPASSRFTSGVAYKNNLAWIGDVLGNLYALDCHNKLMPTANTPVQSTIQSPIRTTPTVVTDTSGNTSVFFGIVDQATPQLYLFNPAESVGAANPTTIDTGQTAISMLSRVVTNGVIYVGGFADFTPGSGNNATGQVFAININNATQATRDFIIESQLMQDFDDPATPGGGSITTARYQTQITLVDHLKTPRPYEAVKIWADAPTTISVDGGPPVAIGPGDAQFVAVQTGVDGTLTLTSGHLLNDGSDDTDLHAVPLRVWAGFMDPFERVVVFTDQAFHTRITTAMAVTDPTSLYYDEPTVVNLHAATSYAPDGTLVNPPLFTPAEQAQKQPGTLVSAIQSMTAAVNASGNTAASFRAKLSAQGVSAYDDGKYIPDGYDLPGMAYFNVNTPATRPAVLTTPTGFSLTNSAGDSSLTTYAALSHADATTAIDALDGQDWKTSALMTPAGSQRVERAGGFWSSFWDFIKKAASTITHIVISIAREAYAGIRFVIDKVVYFFKHPLQSLEDIVSAVGAFFIKIGKTIKNVVEALSILFHLEEISKTHILLRDELLRRVNGDPADPTHYPGLVSAIGKAKQGVTDGFQTIEADINGLFNTLANEVKGTQTSDLRGSGATAHTALTVTSKATGKSSSHATQGMWANYKLTRGAKSATVSAIVTTANLQSLAADPIADAVGSFFTDFISQVTNNGQLQTQWDTVSAGFKQLAKTSSAGAFISQGLATLLQTLALLLDGVLAVGQALINSLLDLVARVVTALFDPNTGLLTRTLHIPVLSSLYQKIFGEPLTILNVLTLVAAIPVTLLYKVGTGQWPSQATAVRETQAQTVGANAAIGKVVALFGGLITIASGSINALSDMEGMDSPPQPVPALSTAASMIGFLIGIPSIANDKPSAADWAVWGTTGGIAAVSLLSLPNGKTYPNLSNFATLYSSGQTALLGAAQLALFIYTFVKQGNFTSITSDVGFGMNLAGALDNLINPLKLLGAQTDDLGPVIVAAVDGTVGFVVGALTILISFGTDTATPEIIHRYYFPIAAQQGRPSVP